MTIQIDEGIRASWYALLVVPLFALAGQAQAMEPAIDSNRKTDSGAPAASSKSVRKEPAPSGPKRLKQQTRSEQSPVSSAPRKATNAPIAATGATAKQDQVQDVPCFKTRLCE